MSDTALYYALSTIAQCAAALAALIGFLGLWRLDRLREHIERLSGHPKDDPTQFRLPQLERSQRRLLRVLQGFLVVTLVILGAAIVGFLHVDWAVTSVWTPRLLYVAGVLLVVGPMVVVFTAARLPRPIAVLALLLALATPTLAATTRCTTYEEKTLGRLHTLCDDGTRAISTYNKTLSRWESTITPPGQTCSGRLNPRTHQWEGCCR